MRVAIPLCLVLTALTAASSRAVLIDSWDGSANVSAPPDDPGWANVGQQGYLTSVYVGNGWVLTANHVPVVGAETILQGVGYRTIDASRTRVMNKDLTPTDLHLIRLENPPDLPTLLIRPIPPAVGDRVVMVGYGRDRGAERRDLFRPYRVRDGWEWLPDTHTMRWGTNFVSEVGLGMTIQGSFVHHFTTRFDRGLPTPYEAYATPGDSGGPVFIKRDKVWELAGIMFASDNLNPPYEHVAVLSSGRRLQVRTYCVDLSYYRRQILEIIRRDEPSEAAASR